MSENVTPSVPTRLAPDLHEIQAVFDDQGLFDAALDQLRLAGFDRVDLSVPEPEPHAAASTPEGSAAHPDTPIDRQQIRTLAGSTAGITAAMVGATVTVATGGAAALAAGIAVAAGAVVGGATHAVTASGTDTERQVRDAKASEGRLILSVRTRSEPEAARAVETLRAAGARRVEPVNRADATPQGL